jgi:acyl-CoA thioesterase-1
MMINQHSRRRALGLMIALGFASALPMPSRAIASAQAPRVMVYGDSLSAAYRLDPKEGWVNLLQIKLKAEGVTIINSSVSGETSSGGLSRIKTDLERVKPNLVVLALGANDALRGLPIVDIRKNLQAIIEASVAKKAKVLLIGIQIPPNYGIDYARQFSELYFDLAKTNHLPAPPFLLEGFADNFDMFLPDHVHPTAKAQPLILANVQPSIRAILKLPRIWAPAKP